MKRLTPDQKARILLAARDAVFQQIADHEDDMTNEALEEAGRAIEKIGVDPDNDAMWAAIEHALKKEVGDIFFRIFESIKKGDDQ